MASLQSNVKKVKGKTCMTVVDFTALCRYVALESGVLCRLFGSIAFSVTSNMAREKEFLPPGVIKQ